MANTGTGSLREQAAPQSSVRGSRTATLGRRRLPPAANDNRPTLLRLLKISAGPVLIVAIAAAVYWN
ncbi:MAG: hypothetical protein JNL71_16955 [Rhodospirillales bacterium]|nr:hypothetical protein [Rhodospirillales bacterium]